LLPPPPPPPPATSPPRGQSYGESGSSYGSHVSGGSVPQGGGVPYALSEPSHPMGPPPVPTMAPPPLPPPRSAAPSLYIPPALPPAPATPPPVLEWAREPSLQLMEPVNPHSSIALPAPPQAPQVEYMLHDNEYQGGGGYEAAYEGAYSTGYASGYGTTTTDDSLSWTQQYAAEGAGGVAAPQAVGASRLTARRVPSGLPMPPSPAVPPRFSIGTSGSALGESSSPLDYKQGRAVVPQGSYKQVGPLMSHGGYPRSPQSAGGAVVVAGWCVSGTVGCVSFVGDF